MKIFRIIDNQCLYSIVCATTEEEAKRVFLDSYCPSDIYSKEEQNQRWKDDEIQIVECSLSEPSVLLLVN